MALTLDLFVRKRLTYQDLNNKIQIPIQNYINQKCVIQDEVSADIAANKIVRRDAQGRVKFAAPEEPEHGARKAEVDAHEGKTSTHGATATPTANRIAMYDSGKRLSSGAAPTSDNHVVRKIDMEAAKKHSLIYLGESESYGGSVYAIAVDDNYVYVGGDTTNKVYKLNKSNLSKVTESVDYGGAIGAIAVDDNYVYIKKGSTIQKVYKLNKSNLSKVAESADYGGSIYAIAVDDNYVYIGGTARKVYKLNKSNLSKVAESIDYGKIINAIAVDDDHVYIGGTITNKVYKLLNLVSLKN